MKWHFFSYLCIMKRAILTYLCFFSALLVHTQSQTEWIDRAFAYVEQDSLEQAEKCFQEAAEQASSEEQRAMLLANLGTIQRQRGRIHESIDTHTQALALSPFNADLLMHRAMAYIAIGNDDKAYIDLCNILDREHNHKEALYYRAFINTQRHDYAAARTDYKRLLSNVPNHSDALLGLALLDQREGRMQAAEQQITILIEQQPDNITYLLARSDVYAEQNLYDLALLDLDAAIDLQSDNAQLYATRAELYLKMKRYTAAKADLDKATSIGMPRAALANLYKQCE